MSKVKRTRRKFSNEFKTKVCLEAIKERQTLSELAEKHNIQQESYLIGRQNSFKELYMLLAVLKFNLKKHLQMSCISELASLKWRINF